MLYWVYKQTMELPVPYVQNDYNFAFLLLIQMYQRFERQAMPLPYFGFRIRSRILEDEMPGPWVSNDVYGNLIIRPYEFWILSGETVESFQELVTLVSRRLQNYNVGESWMTIENRILLTLIWLRQYPTYTLLSLTFGISVSAVGRIVNIMWIPMWEVVSPLIHWPAVQDWRNCRGRWPEMSNVVGCIDGTSHEILTPMTEPQEEFYSGHRKYHCIHTQVIIDNDKNIVYVHSGFLGHENDAHAYRQFGPIGPGQLMDFPNNCYILADSIYPNEYPLVTPFKSVDIVRAPRREQRRRRKFNALHRKRRVYVEHIMKEFKTFRVVGSLYRHPRWQMASIVELCVGLSQRRTI
ncbi:Hypothetical predicted protein [Mytilus galloprovincialis]|uniref:DDE Tnp4 domain-containing protein n=1 Tax=Mytilus galloprovincialis TaxID=29158 RepID=A0A8B6F660_MYTGA|nr:Hypothetical predicted protein [Mytilus galloprovincialis]